MAIFSPLRMRRTADRSTTATRRFITFQISKQFCAIPIEMVVKAAFMDAIYTDVQHPELLLTRYKGKELLLLDVGKALFDESVLDRPQADRQLLIVRMVGDQAIGIPIDSSPTTYNVSAELILPSPPKLPAAIEAVFTADNTRYFVLNLASL
jgi:chemotaxis signal transduction protein